MLGQWPQRRLEGLGQASGVACVSTVGTRYARSAAVVVPSVDNPREESRRERQRLPAQVDFDRFQVEPCVGTLAYESLDFGRERGSAVLRARFFSPCPFRHLGHPA